jgi:serine/threonine protein kinase
MSSSRSEEMSSSRSEDAGSAGQIPMEHIIHQEHERDEQHRTECTEDEGGNIVSSNSDYEFEEDDLKDYLLVSMEKSSFNKTPHEFLPRDKFDGIFSMPSTREQDQTPALHSPRDTVFRSMGINSAAPTDDELSLAEYVLENCRTLYLIAVFIESKPELLRTLMSIFRRDNFTDSKLPIDMWPMERLRAGTKKHPFHPFVEMERHHEPARALRLWNFRSIVKFQNEQWKFLVPTISTTKNFHDFRQYTVPFIAKHNLVGKGNSGIVYKYEIHPAHFEDPASRASSEQGRIRQFVAVKEIWKEGSEVAARWEKEVKTLAKMNELNHKHIVRFITSFRRRDTSDEIEHYVMLEWADGGNLRDFYAAYPNPDITAKLVKWVVRQLHGLAQVLSKAHNLKDDGSYRHGDLKPANILWFKEGDTKFGTLKIGDWGEAKEHYNGTGFNRDTAAAEHQTRRYEPPEVQTGLRLKLSGESRIVRSRLYDIWGIGCITLESLIWLMYGLGGLKRFNRSNIGDYGVSYTFYEVSLGKPAKVHAVAEYWMRRMAMEPRCTRGKTALGDLLEIVRTGLLIVKLPPEEEAKRPHLHSSHVPETPNLDSWPSTSTPEITDTGHDNAVSIEIMEGLQDPILATPQEPKRCLATDFEIELLRILDVEDESYWYTKSQANNEDETSSTLQGTSSVRISQSETLGGTDQISNEAKDRFDDDSLAASSEASHNTTSLEQEGQIQIAYFLATDPELRTICSIVIGSLDKAKDEANFAVTGRRVLKEFYNELSKEARSESQSKAARLLKTRRSRNKIIKRIAETITAATTEDTEDAKGKNEEIPMREMLLEKFLADQSSRSSGVEQSGDWIVEYPEENEEGHSVMGNRDGEHDTSSESKSGNTSEEDVLPNLSEMHSFFRNSMAFQVLLEGFRDLLPFALRDIISVTPVELSNKEDRSLANRMKAMAEDYTMLDWNWWPLEPCMRPLKHNQTRLIWTCVGYTAFLMGTTKLIL